jgi:hypothetical protein
VFTGRLNYCRGGYVGRKAGAHWQNYAKCPTCGKRIKVRRDGYLRDHGTRVEDTRVPRQP